MKRSSFQHLQLRLAEEHGPMKVVFHTVIPFLGLGKYYIEPDDSWTLVGDC
jgi:hypothetical protein